MYLAMYYRKLANAISMYMKEVPSNIAVLIVSDHGYDPNLQEHSNYGFWSINIDDVTNPRTILDFKELILSLLQR